jgi:hypothetical protein
VRPLWPGPSSRTRKIILQVVIAVVLYVGAGFLDITLALCL